MFKEPYKKSFLFIIIVLIYYLLGYLNYARAFKIAIFGFISIGFFGSLYGLYRNKFTKTLFIFAIILSFLSLLYFAVLRDIFGISQDDLVVMQAIMDTDSSETKKFFIQYYKFIIKHIILILTFLFVYLKLVLKSFNVRKKSLYIFGFLLILLHLNPTMRHTNPINYIYHYSNEYIQQIKQVKELNKKINNNLRNKKIKITYTGKDNKNTIVWIIGESETRYNWSLYGYKRDTNKYLENIKNELKIFKNITASAPATVPAFKLMLTDANRSTAKSWLEYPNIVLLAKKAGYKTYWISNHTSDSRGAINIFAKSADVLVLANKGRSRGEGSYDEVLLPYIKKALNDKAKKNSLLYIC